MAKILIVEDDLDINDGLTYALSKEGHFVVQSFGKEVINDFNYDLAILDVNLPGTDGFTLSKCFKCPILFLTAKNLEEDMLNGFSLGCEDYITKPFSLPVLKERVNVIIRRNTRTSTYAIKGLSYDKDRCQLEIDSAPVKLTKREHQILSYLIAARGKVVTKGMLLEGIWDVDGEFVNEGTVSVTVNRLRKKMDPDGRWIQTIFGIGYKWSESNENY
ncbi:MULTISPECIES: response regulator transcription factor [unclassified Fusibacter]|uniref:response regulator transcription factor n=1 Tax=unclassified Fusibacter TaxID=2624464 RepID=UPI0010108E25|nr:MULTISPECIES: response regulator transcription factor [unclassified Fusibacter]MCK8058170.1 response regulator transcription factor [Fusibacter sp. A2]NPE20753.1 response regulator transcription factor [Fusibacter sp. A1]RXV62960.1 DNA-binding response regulator [Fusibacter sp. A1]